MNEYFNLTHACRNGNFAKVKELIEDKGVSPGDSDFYMAIHCAVKGDWLEIVEYLINKGANLEIYAEDGLTLKTPLLFAMDNCNVKIFNALIK